MADGDLGRRRSLRLIKLKEASESEASRMIKLKREWRVLMRRQMERVEAATRDLAAEYKARKEGAPPPPCDPLRPLSAAPPLPPQYDSFLPPWATPRQLPSELFRPLSDWVTPPPPPPPCDPPSLLPGGSPFSPAGWAGRKEEEDEEEGAQVEGAAGAHRLLHTKSTRPLLSSLPSRE